LVHGFCRLRRLEAQPWNRRHSQPKELVHFDLLGSGDLPLGDLISLLVGDHNMQEILEKINQWDFGNLGPSFVAGFEMSNSTDATRMWSATASLGVLRKHG